jgi:hypothetical protein
VMRGAMIATRILVNFMDLDLASGMYCDQDISIKSFR